MVTLAWHLKGNFTTVPHVNLTQAGSLCVIKGLGIKRQNFATTLHFISAFQKRHSIIGFKMPPKAKKSKSDFILCAFCGERPKEGPNGPYMSGPDLYGAKGLCSHAPWCKDPESLYQCGWCDHFNLLGTICGCFSGKRPQKITQFIAHLGNCSFCEENEKMEGSTYCDGCRFDLYQSQWKLYAFPPAEGPFHYFRK